jgi:CRISPR-associated endonuclease/helicase Cas3
MTEQVKIKILPQYVKTVNQNYLGHKLHKIQASMFEYNSLQEVVILSAPTGTGKSFSFPLPLISRKDSDNFSKMRCMIISPTNALIDDMLNQYNQSFNNLKIAVLNRKRLDEINAHGLMRWEEIVNIVSDNDVIITNPDLINWALFGGYSYSKRQYQISFLFSKIDYFVFDEYHLYDEEQIASIISLMITNRVLIAARPFKYVFASATPEPKLKELLQKYGYKIQEIVENIENIPTENSRQIHGELTVLFRKIDQQFDGDDSITEYLIKNRKKIQEKYLDKDHKVLVIYDKMVSLRKFKKEILENYSDYNIAEESGYLTKRGSREILPSTKLVLATNKVEVGVNLGVSVCLMQSGNHYSNFIQRIGRVARGDSGDLNGILIVFVKNIIPIQKVFAEKESISYYDFMQKIIENKIIGERNFYSEKVSNYLGAYFYIILSRSIKDFATRQIFKEKIMIDAYESDTKLIFHTMDSINKIIFKDLQEINKKNSSYSWELKALKIWWVNFLNTFRYFRNISLTIKFIDLDMPEEQQFKEYSLEWVLANRFIVGERIVNNEKYFEVSGFRQEKNELQFIVETFPLGKLTEENRYLSQKEKWDLKNEFLKRTNKCLINWSPENRSQDDFSKKMIELLEKISNLRMIFTSKRLVISDIDQYSNFIT